MRLPSVHPRTAALATVLSCALLGACSVDSADSSVAVTGTDDTCDLENDSLTAGRIDFEFTNTGGDVSELYVLRANGDVVGEVENVTTGTSRTLTVDLAAGDYEVRCKPGQTGDGYASRFTVTGEGGAVPADADYTIEFTATDFTYPDLDLTRIVAGDTIRFVMTKEGTQAHEFEVLDPTGEALGEVASLAVGDEGGATITFPSAGTYTFQCILIDPATDSPHTELGMTGTFVVPAS